MVSNPVQLLFFPPPPPLKQLAITNIKGTYAILRITVQVVGGRSYLTQSPPQRGCSLLSGEMLLSFTTPHKSFYPHPFLLVSFILVGLHQPYFLSLQMEHNEFNDLLLIDLTFRNRSGYESFSPYVISQ